VLLDSELEDAPLLLLSSTTDDTACSRLPAFICAATRKGDFMAGGLDGLLENDSNECTLLPPRNRMAVNVLPFTFQSMDIKPNLKNAK
jgi:hypothetical protein